MNLNRRTALAGLGAFSLAGCDIGGETAKGPPVGSLEWALVGDWRIDRERDEWRHPLETLRFWGLRPNMTVLEIYPGRGWWTSILAPYLRAGGGWLIVGEFSRAGATQDQIATMRAFSTRFADEAVFGRIDHAEFSATSPPPAPENGVDLAILSRNVHTLMAQRFAEKAFRDIAAVLKPGGVLGVEQHRAPASGVQDPLARSGYVQEPYVRALAEEAGLDFVGASEVNANPKDDHEHPFGVWTLPPTLATAPIGRPDDPAFDTGPYRAIGESDRMTLKFRKRREGEAAPAPAPAQAPPAPDADPVPSEP
ncbi:MAG: class I SAM-dependent methyltransferase [Hyphomonadaceae bacterium]|nr:class I SAM-dependent methyltransferase [Hyphomonadaceae bacterium]